MSGVPEWSQAELDAVRALYEQRGRQPKWKPIAVALQTMNADGSLNAALAEKGLHRSNNCSS